MINWSTISLRDLAGYVSEELRNRGIETILVGGACVTIYSENRYQSYDLDYITYDEMKKVKKALQDIGFLKNRNIFNTRTAHGLSNLFLHQSRLAMNQFTIYLL